MKLFKRNIFIIIDWQEGTEKKIIQIPDLNLLRSGSTEELRIDFKVLKTDSKETNEAEISIFNLSTNTRKKIEDAKNRNVKVNLSLFAGYGDDIKEVIGESGEINISRIFYGNILSYKEEKNNVDRIVNLKCRDGWKGLDQVISLSFDEGSNTNQILDRIRISGGFIDLKNELPNLVYNNGFSYVGKLSNAISKIVDRLGGYEWSIRNNALLITKIGSTSDVIPVIDLNSKTGLLKTERIKEDEVSSKGGNKKTFNGWKVRSYIVPNLDLKSLIKLEIQENTDNLPQKTLFVIKKILFTGSNRDNDFTAEMEAIKYV